MEPHPDRPGREPADTFTWWSEGARRDAHRDDLAVCPEKRPDVSDRLDFSRGQLFHMTLVERLPVIVAVGKLLCDAQLQGEALPGQPIAHEHIKARRRNVEVPVPPGGTLGDYVPFYLAPRSPMLAANHYGGVEGRSAGQDGIVYLVTDIDRLAALGGLVLTSKHPTRRPKFSTDLDVFNDPSFIDWDVMFDPWFTSETDTERPERRQAEVLVHGEVPLDAFIGLAARTEADLAAARQMCEAGFPRWHFKVRADWYF